MAELQNKQNEVSNFRMFSSDQVGCTSISQAVQLLENEEDFYTDPHQCPIFQAS